MRATFLGTGTSTGVPLIGCRCSVCTSDDPRNQRLRPSMMLEIDGAVVVIDTSSDFRQQALRYAIPRVDAVLFTHLHADHILGLDDLRAFNFRQQASIPCFGSEETLAALKRTFRYAFEEVTEGGGVPSIDLLPIEGPFEVVGRKVTPVNLFHGSLSVLGYRLGDFAYLTDCNRIPEESWPLLEGLEVLVLDALRYRPHSTHFNVEQALEVAARIGARRTILTHIAHEIDHTAPRFPLPESVEFGYDGLAFAVD